jgi:cyclopropane-fatty-acyl-phospholipid synthase
MNSAESSKKGVRSTLVRAVVRHWRSGPRSHAFSYPMLTLQLDVDELESSCFTSVLLRYNRRAVCSIRGEDYLLGTESLRKKVSLILERHGQSEAPARITLVTMPRYFGYVFNPVSFFICYDRGDKIVACITQVNNTFGETHVYPLVCQPSNVPVSWSFPKSFFVSPFFDTQGSYTLEVVSEGEYLHIKVGLEREGTVVFAAALEGDAEPLSNRNLFRVLVRYPVTLLLTMPRIHLQALVLFFRAKATPFQKPAPSGPYTIRSNPNIIHRVRLAFLTLLRAGRKV